MSVVPYKVDHSVQNTAKKLGFSKKHVSFKFGFANPGALGDQAKSGAACRGSEHSVLFVWSLKSGKRQLTVDGKIVHSSESGKNGWTGDRTWQHTFPLRNHNDATGDSYKVELISQVAQSDIPDSHPFDLRIDGISYFQFNEMWILGTSDMVTSDAMERKIDGQAADDAGLSDDLERQDEEQELRMAQAKVKVLQDRERQRQQQHEGKPLELKDDKASKPNSPMTLRGMLNIGSRRVSMKKDNNDTPPPKNAVPFSYNTAPPAQILVRNNSQPASNVPTNPELSPYSYGAPPPSPAAPPYCGDSPNIGTTAGAALRTTSHTQMTPSAGAPAQYWGDVPGHRGVGPAPVTPQVYHPQQHPAYYGEAAILPQTLTTYGNGSTATIAAHHTRAPAFGIPGGQQKVAPSFPLSSQQQQPALIHLNPYAY